MSRVIKKEYIDEAKSFLKENWKESADAVIGACEKAESKYMSMSDFLSHCSACGGNWGGMFLTGIKRLFPAVYDAIPNDMGHAAFQCICYTLLLCNVDTTCD